MSTKTLTCLLKHWYVYQNYVYQATDRSTNNTGMSAKAMSTKTPICLPKHWYVFQNTGIICLGSSLNHGADNDYARCCTQPAAWPCKFILSHSDHVSLSYCSWQHDCGMQVVSAAKLAVLLPYSCLYPSSTGQQELVIVLRGAVRLSTASSQSTSKAFAASQDTSTHSQTDKASTDSTASAASLPPEQGSASQPSKSSAPDEAVRGSDQYQLQDAAKHMLPTQSEPQAPPNLSNGEQGQPSVVSQMPEKCILDARGCAFGLPGLLQGSGLQVQANAETVIEAYSIPWSLIQVGHLHCSQYLLQPHAFT